MYGKLDQSDHTLNLDTKYLGIYQLRFVERSTSFSFDQAGVSNRFITPNGDGKNDTVVFSYDNPRDASVRVRILDVRGRVVAPELPQGPISNSRVWDARSGGAIVPSGVYLYQIDAEGHTYSGSIVILK
jgi:gliding motility-associated-like protein